ncbi:hypothetical protein H310_06247 [Aphanomyces invadans]|uniref:FYVE-type domain-containing protein n=1 Tax=Aphanomyces invadans TaxID=157072 RepID=A0A024U7M4_9STRA|nr:hypothetical protein H310_06247 [Aphanomyces invadans]ETW01613.1 hypothetical protein H310_06247 [Aphanomyces invadans]RHY31324.1 hypothetical protein DYB32_003587 [Aphanomyces invadans]|eukprot:XP_008869461.1 hypothetical protein H310_06247 [Aphanomyces invadans]
MSTSLPLPKGYFDMSRITEAERDQYTEYAASAIRKVFALSDSHKNSWVPVVEKKGVSIYRNFSNVPKPRSNSTATASSQTNAYAYKSNIAEVGCKSTMQASLDEICRAFSAHDDGLFRRLMRKLNPRVVDAAVLQNIVPRTPEHPYRYVGIKWFAVKSSSMMVTNRDYCCLEVMDRIVDNQGHDMFVRVLSSIDIPECPSLENSHGFVRGKILAGYIYRMDSMEAKVARLHHVARFDPNGYCPTQLSYKIAEKDVVTSMVQLKRIIEKQQMTSCVLLDKAQWVPSASRSSCTVCGRGFGLFRHRHHCRACGEVICGKCSIQRPVEVPGTSLKKVRICTLCNMGVNKGTDGEMMQELSMLSVTSGATQAYNEMNMYDLYNANGPSTPSAYSTASNGSNISNVSYRSTATDYQRGQGSTGQQPPQLVPAPVPMSRNPSWGRIGSQESMSGRSQLTKPVDLSYLPKTSTTPSSSSNAYQRRHSAAATTPRSQAKLDLSYLPQTPKTPRGQHWSSSGPTTPETPNRTAPPSLPTTPNNHTLTVPSPLAAPTIAPTKPRQTTYFGEGSLNFGKPSAATYGAPSDPARPSQTVEVARSMEDLLRKSYSGIAVDYVYNMLGDRTQPSLNPCNVPAQAT